MRSIDIDPQSPPRRVLILRLSALGDVLHCLPALEALRELWPVADFDWVSESLAASLLEGHPDLRRVIPFPRKEMSRRLRRIGEWGRLGSEWRAFAGELRRERYDLVIDFQGNLRSTLVSRVSRYRRRVGHHPSEVKEHPWLLPPASPDRPAGRVHRVEKNLHLVGALGWQGETPPGRLPDYATERRRLLSLPALEGAPPVILHPFVSPFGRFKEWPSSAFAVLARCLADRGRRVLVTSEPGSRGSAERIVRLSGGAAAPAPETPTVRDLAALLSLAAAVVAADTGPLHVAALSRVPAFGLYGPKDPAV
ncbi:MAG: glycosyltransferase family 9 protein, partial [Planctomycetota bacterium]